MLVYVDDMLITGDSLELIEKTKTSLQQTFKVKYFGEIKYFLSIEFVISDNGMVMHQRKYTLELISEVGLTTAKPASTPIDHNVKLTSTLYDIHVKDTSLVTDQIAYQRLIGKFLYLIMTKA